MQVKMGWIDIVLVYFVYFVSICFACPFHDADNSSKALIFARKAALDRTNEYRAKHGVPPLKQDATANQVAQKYADHLCETCVLQHSQNRKYGENIFGTCGYDVDTSSDKKLGEFAVWGMEKFYNEEKDYDYTKPGFQPQTGHFTALVWKSTKAQGVGIGVCKKGGFVVVNYTPQGNVVGSFAKNVPHIGGATEKPDLEGGGDDGGFGDQFGRK